MNAVLLFDFPFDIGTLPYIIGFGCIIFAAFVIYKFYIEPKITLVFPEEKDEGYWTVPLGPLNRTAEGEVCTAQHHYEAWFSSLISSAAKIEDKNTVERLIKLRDHLFKAFLYAQQSQAGKILYLFDENPLDQKYHTAHGNHRYINNVQDCQSGGEGEDGIEIISVKLNKDTAKYTREEREQWTQREEAVKFIRLTASNAERIAHLEERVANDQLVKDRLYDEVRKAKTGEDTANLAAGIQPLTTPVPQPPKPTMFGAISKKLLSKGQIIVLFISGGVWFGLTNLLKGFGVVVPDPSSIGLIAGVAVFFGVPIIRGWRANR